jgi:hypothetical protein
MALLLASALAVTLLAACSGDSSDESEAEGVPSDPRDAIALILVDFTTIEGRVPAVLQTQGDVSDTELGEALLEAMAICQRAPTMEEGDPQAALNRACTRFLYGGAIRSMASGNADFLLDGINDARTVLADYQ